MKVYVELDDLAELLSTAKLSEYRQTELDRVKKDNADNAIQCEKLAKEINLLQSRNMEAEKELALWNKAQKADKPEEDARAYLAEHGMLFETIDVDKACEVIRALLSRPQQSRELQPVTKTAISNAKDVLRALYQPIVSEENLPNETVPGDRFHTVYNALRDLVSRLEQEGLS